MRHSRFASKTQCVDEAGGRVRTRDALGIHIFKDEEAATDHASLSVRL